MATQTKTSYGEQLLERFLLRIVRGTPERNVRPEWLLGLELDFWYPAHNLAFEFQGGQHYTDPVQQRRDSRKRALCRSNGIPLIRIDAADLSYQRIIFLIRNSLSRNGRRKDAWKITMKGRGAKKACKPAGRAAIEYRHLLIDRFNCPSARRRNSGIRKAVLREKRRAMNGSPAEVVWHIAKTRNDAPAHTT